MLGKSIAGGIPVAVWGTAEEIARRIWTVRPHFKPGYPIDHFGFGGTLAGSALQMAAIRATLEQVTTEENYARMSSLAERMETGVRELLVRHDLPWHVTRIGARLEYLFSPRPPRTGGEAHRARHPLLEECVTRMSGR